MLQKGTDANDAGQLGRVFCGEAVLEMQSGAGVFCGEAVLEVQSGAAPIRATARNGAAYEATKMVLHALNRWGGECQSSRRPSAVASLLRQTSYRHTTQEAPESMMSLKDMCTM